MIIDFRFHPAYVMPAVFCVVRSPAVDAEDPKLVEY